MEKLELDLQTIKNFLVPYKYKISAEIIYETQDFLRQRGYIIKTIERASDSGALMLAYNTSKKEDVFIKLIKHYDTEDFNEVMLYDAQTIQIKSKFLLKNQDLICDLKNSLYFLVIEYSLFKNLRQFLNENSLTVQQIQQIIVNILFSLNDVHNYGQVLMQLNPSNILISEDLNVKILNLGSSFNTFQMIQKHNPFLPKEQSFLSIVTPQTNYYSLGAIICLLCNLDVQENILLSKNCKKGFFPQIQNEFSEILDVAFQMMNYNPTLRIDCVKALQNLQTVVHPQIKQSIQKYSYFNQIVNDKQQLKKTKDLQIQTDGIIYIGDFSGDKKNGQGILINLQGERYEGEFADDKFHGQGSFFDKNGNVYIGEWYQGKMQGKGMLYYANSDLYDGYFFNGKKNGSGILYFNKGEKYEGEWDNDERQGYGKLKLFNNQKYEGFIKQGSFHGKGKFTYQDGSFYDGEWNNNQRHGYGEYSFQNGDRYLGNYCHDKKEGNGTYYYITGSIYKGEWKKDLKNGYGLYTTSCNEIYEGSFKNGKRSGYGIYKYQNGLIYQGEWENDLKNGQGILLQGKAIIYQGIWLKGQKQYNLIKEES